jgi:hypothetical protein
MLGTIHSMNAVTPPRQHCAARVLSTLQGRVKKEEHPMPNHHRGEIAAEIGGRPRTLFDLVRIIGAGLRGAGEPVGDNEVAAMTVAGGAAGYVRIAAALLAATFDDAGAR